MPKFSSITHGEFAGDIIAGQITKALQAGEPVWRAVGNVLDMFFDERWIEISFDPSVTPVYGQGDSPCSPLTKAWQIDPLTELPVAVWFKSGWGLLDWSQWWSASGGVTVPTRYPGPMTPVGTDDAGTPPSNQWADGRHSHPYSPAPPPPALATSSLYTAKVGSSLFRGDVYCAFMSYYTCPPTYLFAGWTEIAPGIMQKDDPGPISQVQLDGINPADYSLYSVSPLLGATVMAFDYGIDDDSKKLMGPWVVDDVGGHMEDDGFGGHIFVNTNARMHRHPDYSYSAAFVHGMQFQCLHGDTFAGGHFTLNSASVVLGTTLQDWSWAAGPADTTGEKFELLTGPQLTSEGASSDYLDMSVTSGAGLGGFADTQFPLSFTSLVLGVSELAVGPYTVDIETAAASGMDPGTVAMLRMKLIDVDNGNAVILIVDSPPVTASGSRPETLHFVGSPLSSPYTFDSTRRLKANFYLHTNSVSPVTMGISYNGTSRGNKITFPFSMPVTGASDGVHDHLSGRDTVNNHFGVGTATTVSGIIPVPTKKKMVVTVSGNPVLQGMHFEGLETGVDIALTFLQSCSIIGEATGLGTGVCQFLTSHMDGTTPDNLDTLPAGARMGVTYYATELPQSPCFQLTWGPLS
jgi:hypothetical protein